MNGQAKRAASKRTLPPAMRLEGEKKAIEKKLEELKVTLKKTSERGRRMENAEPSTSLFTKGRILSVPPRP